MARNGAGVYSLPSGNPVVTGTTISSTTYNNTLTDIASALTGSVAADGQTPMTGNLAMGSNKVTGLVNGSAATDAATIGNLQNGTGIYIGTVGGTADVITLTSSPPITSYVAGQMFSFIASGANTTNVTVNISGLGAKALTKTGAVILVANDILSGALVTITYDGMQFQIENDHAVVHNTLLTTTGDMVYASSANTPARLAVGASGTALVGGTTPSWADHVELGSPTGGSKGSGTANAASGFYDNGSRVSHLLLGTGSVSVAASATITSNISSTFDEYEIHLHNVLPDTNNVALSMQVSENGGSIWKNAASSYEYGSVAVSASTSTPEAGSAANTSMILTSTAAAPAGITGLSSLTNSASFFVIKMFFPSSTTLDKAFSWNGCYLDAEATAAFVSVNGGGRYKADTAAINALKFFSGSGNISLTWYLYGIRKS